LLWWAAAASLDLGEPDEAARLFAQALEKAGPPQADELRRWGLEALELRQNHSIQITAEKSLDGKMVVMP
jgi:hypothetical protein